MRKGCNKGENAGGIRRGWSERRKLYACTDMVTVKIASRTFRIYL